MTTSQHKIGSGFGATSTAADVLAGVDLSGRLALVTGGYSGIGLVTTRALSAAGAEVVVPSEALVGIDRVSVDELDLADLDSVRGFAERFVASGRGIDMVINNAGLMVGSRTLVGPGWEADFATNHLGHFALVNRLWPVIVPGARVVSVSSRGHFYSDIRWDDLHFERDYDNWVAYGQAKTANILFAVQLDVLGRDRGVRAFALHPGRILTNLVRYMDRRQLSERGLFVFDDNGRLTSPVKTPEQGAATQVWAATSPQLNGLGGVYCEDCDVAEPAPADGARVGVRDYAVDPVRAARLWALSAELTGVSAF
jgi:NAD(P)-dependent dehydrogenase (short-subunit alcohol dehydrogenase family)